MVTGIDKQKTNLGINKCKVCGKGAEKGNGKIIRRVYEASGGQR